MVTNSYGNNQKFRRRRIVVDKQLHQGDLSSDIELSKRAPFWWYALTRYLVCKKNIKLHKVLYLIEENVFKTEISFQGQKNNKKIRKPKDTKRFSYVLPVMHYAITVECNGKYEQVIQ